MEVVISKNEHRKELEILQNTSKFSLLNVLDFNKWVPSHVAAGFGGDKGDAV